MLLPSGIGELSSLFMTREGYQSKLTGMEAWPVFVFGLDHERTEIFLNSTDHRYQPYGGKATVSTRALSYHQL